MVTVPEARQALCDALATLDGVLTVSPYRPQVAQPPHAWVDVDVLEPAAFDAWTMTGRVSVVVSESDDEAAWELLDAFDGPGRLYAALQAASIEVDLIRVSDYGQDIDVAGQVFRGFVVEFAVML